MASSIVCLRASCLVSSSHLGGFSLSSLARPYFQVPLVMLHPTGQSACLCDEFFTAPDSLPDLLRESVAARECIPPAIPLGSDAAFYCPRIALPVSRARNGCVPSRRNPKDGFSFHRLVQRSTQSDQRRGLVPVVRLRHHALGLEDQGTACHPPGTNSVKAHHPTAIRRSLRGMHGWFPLVEVVKLNIASGLRRTAEAVHGSAFGFDVSAHGAE